MSTVRTEAIRECRCFMSDFFLPTKPTRPPGTFRSNRYFKSHPMKRSSLGLLAIAGACLVPVTGSAAVTPIAVTGWNRDIIYGVGDGTVTSSMDAGPGSTAQLSWYSLGKEGSAAGTGLPIAETASISGSGASFLLQPATSLNALHLAVGQSGSLALVTPASYSIITLFGATGNGSYTGTVTINFSDLTTQVFAAGNIAQDWFNGSGTAAFANGRYNGTSYSTSTNNPRLYEQSYAIDPANQGKTVVSVTVTDSALAGGSLGAGAILAISGQVVPEPSAVTLLGAAGALGLLRRRRR